MLSRTSDSWANAQNCIFAGNGGAGIWLGESGYNVFTCTESYNVFYGDGIIDEGNVQAPHATTSTRDPEFWAKGAKPDPWYKLGSNFSPAYRSGSDGKNRGAYQVDKIPQGTLLTLR